MKRKTLLIIGGGSSGISGHKYSQETPIFNEESVKRSLYTGLKDRNGNMLFVGDTISLITLLKIKKNHHRFNKK